jgi:hypothetical protein
LTIKKQHGREAVAIAALYRRLSFQDSTNDVFPENSILRLNHKFRDCFNGFDFCLKKDDNNEITGIAWQTGFMRNNFSRYGSYASIDACKRDYCSCGLHYMSVSLRRADGSICVAIEALVESEDIATYSWMWSCLFLMSDDNMSREDVRVVAADQMIKQKNLTEDFNLPNAELIMDRWHLKNKNFQENFKGHHEVIKGSLNELLLAESESEFNDTCKKIEQKLISLGASNQELAYLDTISKKRRHLATYELNSMRCSFGLLGSTASENNHSSINLSYIFSKFFTQWVRYPLPL